MELALDALKDVAGRATLAGGTWAVVDDGVDLCIHRTADDRQIARLASQDDAQELGLWGSEYDIAQHIAAASPAAVLALITEVERLKRALEDLVIHAEMGWEMGDPLSAANAALSPTPAPKED